MLTYILKTPIKKIKGRNTKFLELVLFNYKFNSE